MELLSWLVPALLAGLIVGWLIAFCLDSEAFNSGSRR